MWCAHVPDVDPGLLDVDEHVDVAGRPDDVPAAGEHVQLDHQTAEQRPVGVVDPLRDLREVLPRASPREPDAQVGRLPLRHSDPRASLMT